MATFKECDKCGVGLVPDNRGLYYVATIVSWRKARKALWSSRDDDEWDLCIKCAGAMKKLLSRRKDK